MKRFTFLLLALSLLPSVTQADPDPLRQLRDAALKDDYAYRQVAYLTDNIGPRLTGSAQAQQAVEYVSDEMRRQGLNVTLEPLKVGHWVRGRETAALVGYPGQRGTNRQKIVLTALGGSVPTPPAGLTAEVVVVEDMAALQALGSAGVRGKVVLFNHPFDTRLAAEDEGMAAYGQAVRYRALGPSAAARLGAVASLVRAVGGADFRLPHTGGFRYEKDVPKIPAAAVTAEDAGLMARLAAQGPVKIHLVLTPKQLPDVPSANVIADVPGSEHPEQVVVVSGHLDSWDLGTGAIDDGVGIAAAMEVGHLVRQLNLHPKRTIRVIAWMNEEDGLVGGRTYAKEHDPKNHFAAIESDLGAGHPTGYIAAGVPEAVLKALEPVGVVLGEMGAPVVRIEKEAGADIWPLQTAGVATFAPLQDSRTYFNYHHTAADTLDKVDPHNLAENAAVMAVLSYALADQP